MSLLPYLVDGGWGGWTPWNECSKSCGEGTRLRERRCNNPKPENEGADCAGNSTETELCQVTAICPGITI